MPQFASRADCYKHVTTEFKRLIEEMTGAQCADAEEFLKQNLGEMGMDSLDQVELIMAIEEELLGIEVNDDDAEQYTNRTVGEAVDAMTNNLMARQ